MRMLLLFVHVPLLRLLAQFLLCVSDLLRHLLRELVHLVDGSALVDGRTAAQAGLVLCARGAAFWLGTRYGTAVDHLKTACRGLAVNLHDAETVCTPGTT